MGKSVFWRDMGFMHKKLYHKSWIWLSKCLISLTNILWLSIHFNLLHKLQLAKFNFKITSAFSLLLVMMSQKKEYFFRLHHLCSYDCMVTDLHTQRQCVLQHKHTKCVHFYVMSLQNLVQLWSHTLLFHNSYQLNINQIRLRLSKNIDNYWHVSIEEKLHGQRIHRLMGQ